MSKQRLAAELPRPVRSQQRAAAEASRASGPRLAMRRDGYSPAALRGTIAAASAAIGVGFNLSFIRTASRALAAGLPISPFLGKVIPGLAAADGTYELVQEVRTDRQAPAGSRRWDDALRMAGDGLQVAGGLMAFVPAIGLVPGLVVASAGTLLGLVGELCDDAAPGAPAPPELNDKGKAFASQHGLQPTLSNVEAYIREVNGYRTDGTLGPGSSDHAGVSELQRRLTAAGYPTPATGDYDERTVLSVTAFKIARGLLQSYQAADGSWVVNEMADPRTLAALR